MSGARFERFFVGILLPCMLPAQEGLRPVIGGLPFDSGFALGLEYRKSRLAGSPVDVRIKGIGSVKKYEYLEAALAMPRLAQGWLFAEVGARYRNYTEEDFWGLGQKSPRHRRTTFRMEDIGYSGSFGIRPKRWLEAGLSGGWLATNAGRGKDRDWPSIEELFTSAEVPALDEQPDYLHLGAFLRVDRRDQDSDPRAGGFYQFRYTGFHAQDLIRFSFQRYEFDLRHFIPVFQRRDTVALRAVTMFTAKQANRQTPFFLQPTVGGGGDLRGYLQYRFRDENASVLNAEYRWRVKEFLQIVAFADAARVFSRPGRFGIAGLRGSAGAGVRFKLGESILLGVDLGWSPDGPRPWLRGAHTF